MGGLVHVACKLPAGLIIGGDRISGAAYERVPGVAPPERPGGYAITLNVPAESWERWAAANAATPMIQRELIFADANLAALKAKANSLGHTFSGFEPR